MKSRSQTESAFRAEYARVRREALLFCACTVVLTPFVFLAVAALIGVVLLTQDVSLFLMADGAGFYRRLAVSLNLVMGGYLILQLLAVPSFRKLKAVGLPLTLLGCSLFITHATPALSEWPRLAMGMYWGISFGFLSAMGMAGGRKADSYSQWLSGPTNPLHARHSLDSTQMLMGCLTGISGALSASYGEMFSRRGLLYGLSDAQLEVGTEILVALGGFNDQQRARDMLRWMGPKSGAPLVHALSQQMKLVEKRGAALRLTAKGEDLLRD